VYTVRVTQWHGYYGEHRIRVSLYRNGLPVEVEPNNSLATATPLAYTTNGNNRVAVSGGYTQLDSDLDYFNLGVIEAGKTVILGTRQPTSSPLAPVVSLYNAANAYQTEAGSGRPSDGVAEVRITQTGTYYALLRPGPNSAGLMSEYLLDVLVLPTTDVTFPTCRSRSCGCRDDRTEERRSFNFSFTVGNVGSLATPAAVWFDRAVLSSDTVVDANDIALGLFQHSGALDPGQSYSLTNTLNLPDGLAVRSI